MRDFCCAKQRTYNDFASFLLVTKALKHRFFNAEVAEVISQQNIAGMI